MLNRGESARSRRRRRKKSFAFVPSHSLRSSLFMAMDFFFCLFFFCFHPPSRSCMVEQSKLSNRSSMRGRSGIAIISHSKEQPKRKRKSQKFSCVAKRKKPCNFTEFVHPSSTRGPATTAVKLVGRLVRGVFWWKTEEVFTFSLILAALHLSQKGSNLIITHVLHAIFFIFLAKFISLLVVTRQEQKYKNNKNNISTTEKVKALARGEKFDN